MTEIPLNSMWKLWADPKYYTKNAKPGHTVPTCYAGHDAWCVMNPLAPSDYMLVPSEEYYTVNPGAKSAKLKLSPGVPIKEIDYAKNTYTIDPNVFTQGSISGDPRTSDPSDGVKPCGGIKLNSLLFDPNDAFETVDDVASIKKIIAEWYAVIRNGLYDFKVVCDEEQTFDYYVEPCTTIKFTFIVPKENPAEAGSEEIDKDH